MDQLISLYETKISDLSKTLGNVLAVKDSTLSALHSNRWKFETRSSHGYHLYRFIKCKVRNVIIIGKAMIPIPPNGGAPKWIGGLITPDKKKLVSIYIRAHWYASGISWADHPSSICLGTAKDAYYSAISSMRYADAGAILFKLLNTPPDGSNTPYMLVSTALAAVFCEQCETYTLQSEGTCNACGSNLITGVYADIKRAESPRITPPPIPVIQDIESAAERARTYGPQEASLENQQCCICKETSTGMFRVNRRGEASCYNCEGVYYCERVIYDEDDDRNQQCQRFFSRRVMNNYYCLDCCKSLPCHLCGTPKIRYKSSNGYHYCSKKCAKDEWNMGLGINPAFPKPQRRET